MRIETSDDAARRIFYTALYHTMVAPSEFCDVNGDYRGSDGKIYRAAPFVNYTTLLAVGHLSRRPAPHDDPPPREDARHRQYDAPYLPAAGQASRMAPDG
ncbi:MAG: glycoside hydrolase domain-containing protein [Alistipes sp.]